MLETLLPALDAPTIAVLVSVFLFAGIVKGFLGIGLPAAAMGLLTLVLPPTEAIPLLWLPILATNTLQFAHAPEKRMIARRYAWFAAAIVISIFVTSMFIADYPTALLTVAIGIAMVVFSLNLLLGVKLNIGPGRGWQVGFGLLSGTLGGISSIWSPTVAMYLVARNVSKEHFIGATGFLFLAGCLPLGAGQVIAGILTVPVLLKSILGLGVVLVGFRIGEVLRNKVSQTYFRRAVLIAFLIMGLRLIALGVF
ncbi:sulfite exporter TauE/SafE family protein [uncultured Tateyamaria sp.]|uniref:sulfite exporter TauE/SafE family protein n=1 Tax=uncultured Tateyamaria sp. TaxID=455651 RepID=UPI0026306176|nr:sulfite exporter TauE/SafE family protein [uncultured Tateyamaria sp.]